MDILRFINSKAIRDYLEGMNYDFTQNEIAWLIYQCSNISYNSKKFAWRMLQAGYEDTRLQERCNLKGLTLYEAIDKYISLKDEQYCRFQKADKNAVYSYQFYCPGDSSYCEEFDTKYSSVDKCWNAIIKDMDLGISKITICKEYIDDVSGKIFVDYKQNDGDGKWTVFDICAMRIDDEDALIEQFFEEMYFEFPVPFVAGDIVHIPRTDSPYYKENKSAFVFDKIAYLEYNEFIKNCADNSDMRAIGYFPCDDGTITRDGAGNYMDMEYYDKALEGTMRLVQTVGSFIKGEIDICLLIAAYKKFTIEEMTREYITQMYLPETLEKAGILENSEVNSNAE